MHFITYFNRTDAQLHNYWNIAKVLHVVELVLVVFSHFSYMLVFYLTVKTSWHKKNYRNIWGLGTIQYIPSTAVRATQIVLVLTDSTVYHSDQFTTVFVWTSYVRLFCLLIVSLSLPGIVAERSLATYFLEDYERKQRAYIGYIIVGLQSTFSFIVTYTFHRDASTIPHIAVTIAVNFISVIANTVNRRVNLRYYFESMSRKRDIRAYTLGERYQMAENIRVCTSIARVIQSIGILNIISTLLLVVDNFDVPIVYKNLVVIGFNYSILIYGFLIALVMYRYNDEWQSEVRRILARHRIGRMTESSLSVKSTLGTETHVDKQMHTSLYFSMLQKDWA
ncbi:hypothetical protein Q1695_011773 [Nippostrongylus brasiliensis]|nr:hypothetical protein Q1695_011773 [Nippostrongylus brasiliensis]